MTSRDAHSVIAVAIVLVALHSLLVLAAIVWRAGSTHVRHVDPLAARRGNLDTLSLSQVYMLVALHASNLKLEDAVRYLHLLGNLPLPSDKKYILESFNKLLSTVAEDVEAAENWISVAERALDAGDYAKAREALSTASARIGDAWDKLRVAERICRRLSELGVPVEIAENVTASFARAVAKVQDRLERVREAVLDAMRTAVPTRLKLTVNTTSVEPGDAIEILVCLETVDGTRLPRRLVTVHVGHSLYIVMLGEDGCGRLVTKIREYTESVAVYAEYTPSRTDRFRYTACRSPVLHIRVHFIRPRVSLAVSPPVAAPGDTVEVRVETDPPVAFSVSLPFTGVIDATGNATLELHVPPTAREGVYKIVVKTEPSGIIAPVVREESLVVRRLDINVSVEAPRLVFSGIPVRITVETSVPANVSIAGGECIEASVNDGQVHAIVPLGCAAPKASIILSVEPLDPRYRGERLRVELQVVNTPALITAAAIALAALSWRRRGPATLEGGVGSAETAASSEQRSVATPSVAASTAPSIAVLLDELLKALEEMTGVEYKPSYTLREYLGLIAGRLEDHAYREVSNALTMVEKFAYSKPGAVAERDVEQALRSALEALQEHRE